MALKSRPLNACGPAAWGVNSRLKRGTKRENKSFGECGESFQSGWPKSVPASKKGRRQIATAICLSVLFKLVGATGPANSHWQKAPIKIGLWR